MGGGGGGREGGWSLCGDFEILVGAVVVVVVTLGGAEDPLGSASLPRCWCVGLLGIKEKKQNKKKTKKERQREVERQTEENP